MSTQAWLDMLDGYVDLSVGVVDVQLGGPGGARDERAERLALAALLLDGAGPDGGPLFTHEDVDALRKAIEWASIGISEAVVDLAEDRAEREELRRLESVADRLSALLPPETP